MREPRDRPEAHLSGDSAPSAHEEAAPRPPARPRAGSRALAAALLALLPLATALGTAVWGWRVVHRPYQGWAGEEVLIDLPSGMGARAIVERLEAAGVIPSAGLGRLHLLYLLDDPPLLAGEYRFDRPASTAEVLDRIARGDVASHPLTIVEGLTLEETATAIAAAGFGARGRLLEAMSDPTPIHDLDPAATDLEGYLFPETYAFARGITEREIVATMVGLFRRTLERRLPGPNGQTLSPGKVRDLVTLASIVEKETGLDQERPLVAGVFVNRLALGIPLGADPTIIFALKKAGTWDGNIRRPDLSLDSPYNTYLRAGLPPGPICSPGLHSLRAAAAPAETRHLYFVSRNDGSHVFAPTLQEHNRNVERWQKAFWRDRAQGAAVDAPSSGPSTP
ncbi:MAG TPA: endolytic transglycosylase MltG [Thermoanaerobaculia bacterium]|nr:endolytic transglycosylase MltG [Thermoanaerobaculia bacterium]